MKTSMKELFILLKEDWWWVVPYTTALYVIAGLSGIRFVTAAFLIMGSYMLGMLVTLRITTLRNINRGTDNEDSKDPGYNAS